MYSACINGTRVGTAVFTPGWTYACGLFRYEIETPVPTEITVANKTRTVGPGRYTFYSE